LETPKFLKNGHWLNNWTLIQNENFREFDKKTLNQYWHNKIVNNNNNRNDGNEVAEKLFSQLKNNETLEEHDIEKFIESLSKLDIV
jgi:hypothetical protein